MQVCARCHKWRLLAGQCTVCASIERLRAAGGSNRLPTTLEAEAKTTKILDAAYYSIARLFPESDEEGSVRGGLPPKKGVEEESPKGVATPKEASGGKRKKAEGPGEEEESKKVSEKEGKSKAEESLKSESVKALPKKKEEEERTPQRQKEKDKRKRDKKDSRSRSVSGSRTRRKKREDHSPRPGDSRGAQDPARPSSGIQRESFLRPRPSRREPRSPRTPDHPPPRTSLIPPAAGRDTLPGKGWRGPIPYYSNHPRWSEGTNKGVTKRAKQELYDRKNSRGRW